MRSKEENIRSKEEKITVITADIINSRKNEINLQKRELKNKMNSYVHKSLITEIKFSRGDEIQCVAKGWLKSPEIIRQIRNLFRPIQLRIGIGIEKINIEEINKNPWEMNGNAFYLARDALESLKNYKNPITAIKTGEENLDVFINCIFLLVDSIERKWSDKQWEAVNAYEKYGTYEEAAEHLGVSFQSVNKRCKNAHWLEIQEAEKTISKINDSYLEIYKILF